MHSAQRPFFCAESDICLGYHRVQRVFLQPFLVKHAREKPKVVNVRLDIYNKRAFQFCFSKFHLSQASCLKISCPASDPK